MLDHYSPGAPVNLLGHSMGGNVAGIYAGVRPARVRRMVNLEGFGMPATRPEQAPRHYAKWLDELGAAPALRAYPDLAAVAARLQKTNPRLSDERAAFLAPHWSAPNPAGEWEILADPAHKKPSPVLYRVEEVMACWSAITAPVLWVEAADTNVCNGWACGRGAHRGRPPAGAPGRLPGRDDGRRRPHAAPRPARAPGAPDRNFPLRRVGSVRCDDGTAQSAYNGGLTIDRMARGASSLC
jgi:pimeloyl-ACP methyl ester carboxylesterase